jgi:hypothetical protein
MLPELTVNYILSQAFGLVAVFFVVLGYFMPTKKKQLATSVIENIFLVLSFLFLGTYLVCIGIVIATIRTLIFLVYELNYKQVPDWVISCIFIILTFNGALFAKTPFDIVPTAALLMFTLGFRIRRLVYMRIFFIVPVLMMFTYDIFIFAYTDMIIKAFSLSAIIISISRYYKRKVKFDKRRLEEALQSEGMYEMNDKD